jgi:hypothetical protein
MRSASRRGSLATNGKLELRANEADLAAFAQANAFATEPLRSTSQRRQRPLTVGGGFVRRHSDWEPCSLPDLGARGYVKATRRFRRL